MLDHQKRMLIVDNDASSCDFIASTAREYGYTPTILNQSIHFPLYYSSDISIISLEIFMPEIDGIELLQFLAKQHTHAGIILVSGCGVELLQSTKKFACQLDLSIIACIEKPFCMNDLRCLSTQP